MASNIRLDGNPCLCGVLSSAYLGIFNSSGTQLGSSCGTAEHDNACQDQVTYLSQTPMFNSTDVQGMDHHLEKIEQIVIHIV